jgi:hypothetical protein
MTWKDKLELGLKEDAAFRKDNLPESQVRGPEIPAGPGRSPEIPAARNDANEPTVPQKTGTAEEDEADRTPGARRAGPETQDSDA